MKKHDEINYDISVKNGETSFLLNAIKVEDILPSGLDIQLDAIAWYLGNDSTKQQLVKDSQFVEVMQDAKNKQKLIFTIEALQVEQELHFVIPTKVTDNGDDTLFVNTAKIIEVHQHSFEKESETTYHELDITTADFLFYYPSYIGENHEVTTEFKNLLEDVETAKSFYEKMAAEIHRSPSTIAITAAKTATASAPSVTLTDIGLGYYLICAKHGVEQVYTPTGFNIAPVEEEGTWSVNDQTVTMKSSTPTIVKTVIDPTDTTVAITDSVCYQLTAQIPTYPEDASAITFAIGDKLSEGLTLKPDTIAVKDASGKEIAATNYDVKKDPGKTAKLTDYTFEIVFKEAYIKTNPMLNVQVTYDAEVNDKALTMDALKNIAYIGYNHDPYDTQSYKEKTTEKLVYTYGIKVLKVGESGTDILKNAEFTLSKDGTSLKFKKATDGSYVIDPKGDTVLTVGTDGHFTIQGIDEGSYVLKETKVPDGGYVLPNGDITIALKDKNGNGSLEQDEVTLTTKGTYELEGTVELETNKVVMIVKNSKAKDMQLPITGGAGTVLFSIVGIVFMLGGVLVIIRNSKRHA